MILTKSATTSGANNTARPADEMHHLVSAFVMCFLAWQHNSQIGTLCAEIPMATCEAGTVYVGQKATVTCKFPINVGTEKGEVIVEWLPANLPQSSIRKEALVCGWSDNEQRHECTGAEGFAFNGTITNYLTLVIPNATQEFAGLYFCFLVSSGDTKSEECELNVTERPPTSPATTVTSTNDSFILPPASDQDKDTNPWLIALVIVMFVVILVSAGVGFFVWRRRLELQRWCLRHQQLDFETNHEAAHPLLDGLSDVQQKPRKRHVQEHLKDFECVSDVCEKVMQAAKEEIKVCLTGKPDSAITKSVIELPSLPTGKETGVFIVLELNGTTLRVHHTTLRSPKHDTIYKSYPIPVNIRLGTGIQLFDFITESVHNFMREQQISKKRRRVGLVFFFPCEFEQNLTEARLIKWTHGFLYEDVVGKNIKELLQDSFDKVIPVCKLDVVVIMNDAAGTLISLAPTNPSCWMALTLVNGFHVCFMQKNEEETTPKPSQNRFIVNVDMGALGENGCLDMLRTKYDQDMDKLSLHPDKQILERIVSLTHIGEQLRLVLLALAKERQVFKSVPDKSVLSRNDCFTTDHISLIESDDSDRCLNTDFVLKQLQLDNFTDEDCEKVYDICNALLTRSAHVAGAGLAAVINHLNPSEDIAIAVDGALYRYFPRVLKLLLEEAKKLLEPDIKVELLPSFYGSVFGAALTAAVLRSYRRKVEACVNMQ